MVKPERVAAVVILYLLAAADTLNGGEALRMQVSPAISRAPAVLPCK